MRPFILLSATALLLLPGCDKLSRKSGTAAASPPPPLPIVAISDVPPPPTPTVELKPGSNLGIVAQDAYGHERFSGFVSVINDIADPTKIREGTPLKTPSIPVAFQDAGTDATYQPAINALAKATTDYFAQTSAYRGALTASTEDGKPDIPAGVKTAFATCADTVDAAVAVLEDAKAPHTVPKKSIEQFRQASAHLRELAKGRVSTDDYSQDLVGQRLALGFTNAILWTKQKHQ